MSVPENAMGMSESGAPAANISPNPAGTGEGDGGAPVDQGPFGDIKILIGTLPGEAQQVVMGRLMDLHQRHGTAESEAQRHRAQAAHLHDLMTQEAPDYRALLLERTAETEEGRRQAEKRAREVEAALSELQKKHDELAAHRDHVARLMEGMEGIHQGVVEDLMRTKTMHESTTGKNGELVKLLGDYQKAHDEMYEQLQGYDGAMSDLISWGLNARHPGLGDKDGIDDQFVAEINSAHSDKLGEDRAGRHGIYDQVAAALAGRHDTKRSLPDQFKTQSGGAPGRATFRNEAPPVMAGKLAPQKIGGRAPEEMDRLVRDIMREVHGGG